MADKKEEKKPPMNVHVKKGAFHEWLGKKEDEEITQVDIDKGLASDDSHVRKMANFAKNAQKWKHGKKAKPANENYDDTPPYANW